MTDYREIIRLKSLNFSDDIQTGGRKKGKDKQSL